MQVSLTYPGFHGLSRVGRKLELNRSAGLFLDDRGPFDGLTAVNDVADLEADEITALEFAVDCQVEQSELARVALKLEADTDSADLRECQRASGRSGAPCPTGDARSRGAGSR